MTYQRRKDLVDKIFDQMLVGATDDILPHIKPDAEIHICLGNELGSDSFTATFMGQSGAENFFNICGQFLDFSELTPLVYHEEKDKVIVRGTLECQMVITGITWSSTWMQIWTFEHEKIEKLRMFADFHPAPLADHLQNDLEPIAVTHH